MRTTITYGIAIIALAGSVMLTSCSKTDTVAAATLAVDSSRTVTEYDPGVNFSNYKTIALPDSVVVVNGATISKEWNSTDSAYFVALGNQFISKGFSVVSKSANPDLVLNITRIASTSNGLVDSTGYWSNYASYYNPTIYGESGLSYALNFSTTTSVGDGVLSFELLDIKNAGTNGHVNIIWDGTISGYSLFSDPNSVSLEATILFAKSSYL